MNGLTYNCKTQSNHPVGILTAQHDQANGKQN